MACVLCVMLAPGCASRTEQRARQAWERAGQGPGSEQPAAGTPSADDLGERRTGRTRGWARISTVIQDASDMLASGMDDHDIATLALRWCAEEATPRTGRHGEVRVCVPSAPISVGGHAFTLELGGIGVIGLVASGLSGAGSRQLLEQALREGRGWCAGSWTPVPVREENNLEELHTCPARTGTTVAVGRFPSDASVDLWQVSVAVIGAG